MHSRLQPPSVGTKASIWSFLWIVSHLLSFNSASYLHQTSRRSGATFQKMRSSSTYSSRANDVQNWDDVHFKVLSSKHPYWLQSPINCSVTLKVMVNSTINSCLCREIAPKIWEVVYVFLGSIQHCWGMVMSTKNKLICNFCLTNEENKIHTLQHLSELN